MARLTIDDSAAHTAPGRMLRRLEQHVSVLLERHLMAMDLSVTQWVALTVVRDAAVSTPGELSRELNITTGATTRLIDTLQARGLMLRQRSAEDRRVIGLKVSDAGKAMVRVSAPIVVAGWNELIEVLDDEESLQFSSMLARLLAVAERLLGREGPVTAGETGHGAG